MKRHLLAFCALLIWLAPPSHGGEPASDVAMVEVAKDIYLFRAPDIALQCPGSAESDPPADRQAGQSRRQLALASRPLVRQRDLRASVSGRGVHSHELDARLHGTHCSFDALCAPQGRERSSAVGGRNCVAHRGRIRGGIRAADAGAAECHVRRTTGCARRRAIIYPVPHTPNGYSISRWLESLRAIRAMEVAAIVPGHGPVLKDSAYLDLLIELLSQVTDQVERALESGVLTADLPKSLRLEAIGARFRAQTGVSEEDLGGFIQELVAKVAQESRDGAQFRP